MGVIQMLKFSFLAAFLCASAVCAAAGSTDSEDKITTSGTQIESEGIVHKHTLAAHIGLTTDEAYFGTPRETRGSRYLNEQRLDDAQEIAPIKPRETPH